MTPETETSSMRVFDQFFVAGGVLVVAPGDGVDYRSAIIPPDYGFIDRAPNQVKVGEVVVAPPSWR